MIEAIFLKLCFDEEQLEKYMNRQNQVATIIVANYDEEVEQECYLVQVEKW